MQWLAVVHAVTTAMFGPLRPYMIDSCPEIMLMMVPGTKNGEILRMPPASISVVGIFDQRQAADAGADADADLLAVFLVEIEARILDRIDRRSETVVDESVDNGAPPWARAISRRQSP